METNKSEPTGSLNKEGEGTAEETAPHAKPKLQRRVSVLSAKDVSAMVSEMGTSAAWKDAASKLLKESIDGSILSSMDVEDFESIGIKRMIARSISRKIEKKNGGGGHGGAWAAQPSAIIQPPGLPLTKEEGDMMKLFSEHYKLIENAEAKLELNIAKVDREHKSGEQQLANVTDFVAAEMKKCGSEMKSMYEALSKTLKEELSALKKCYSATKKAEADLNRKSIIHSWEELEKRKQMIFSTTLSLLSKPIKIVESAPSLSVSYTNEVESMDPGALFTVNHKFTAYKDVRTIPVPGPPDFKLSSPSYDKITVTITDCPCEWKEVEGFELRWEGGGRGSNGHGTSELKGHTRSYTISGVEAKSRVYVTLRARNEAGWGAATSRPCSTPDMWKARFVPWPGGSDYQPTISGDGQAVTGTTTSWNQAVMIETNGDCREVVLTKPSGCYVMIGHADRNYRFGNHSTSEAFLLYHDYHVYRYGTSKSDSDWNPTRLYSCQKIVVSITERATVIEDEYNNSFAIPRRRNKNEAIVLLPYNQQFKIEQS